MSQEHKERQARRIPRNNPEKHPPAAWDIAKPYKLPDKANGGRKQYDPNADVHCIVSKQGPEVFSKS